MLVRGGRNANIEIKSLLEQAPDHSGAKVRDLMEERRRLAKDRKAISKSLKNEQRKRKRLLAKLSKFTVDVLVGYAAIKSVRDRRQGAGE